MKKILSLLLIIALLSATVSTVSAAPAPSSKEEVVYGILNLDGSVNNLYVVNILEGGSVTDFGDYSEIRNMTTSEQLNRQADEITIDTKAERFYYQGNLESKELPWVIAIKYHLDGNEIAGTDLAGKSGKLEITMSVNQNTKIDSTFFNNYALQIGFSLDNKLAANIQADNATIAEAGGKKQLNFTVLPGKSMDLKVVCEIQHFEMDAITLNAIRMVFNIDIDSGEFAGQITDLIKAVEGLDDGAGQLLDGLTRLSDGMTEYVNGLKTFQDGIVQLSSGTEQLKEGAKALDYGLSELTKQNNTLVNGALALQGAAFDAVNAQLAGMGLSLPVLTPDNYSTMLASIPDLAPVKQQLDGVLQFTQGLKGYTDGVAQLGKGASELAGGTAKLDASSSEMAAGAKDLYNAGVKLNQAVKTLKEGMDTYKAGTKEFRDGTSDMDEEIDNQINELLASILGKGDQPVSFVSDKNTKVSAVQFVLKTSPILIPEPPKEATPEPVKLSFWQRLLKLFGLYKG